MTGQGARRIRSRLALVLVAFLIFIGGTTFGVYYANELAVLLAAYTGLNIAPSNAYQPPPSPEVLAMATTESVLELKMLADPLPLVFSDTLEEARIQEYLKQGAVILPLGTAFGEPGNVVITAHSSGSAAFGPFRFAFSQLSELQPGDTFTVRTPGAAHVYRVYGHEIVWPHQVDRLPQDDRSTVTLVTCWPLWTNFKRLLVHSELVETIPAEAPASV